ncbi:MAG: CAAD domain-containing protein [Synechococcaceae cyanobacterium]|nr:CAAD domain-containing protein [Synechococcaceae cyanobacterium]
MVESSLPSDHPEPGIGGPEPAAVDGQTAEVPGGGTGSAEPPAAPPDGPRESFGSEAPAEPTAPEPAPEPPALVPPAEPEPAVVFSPPPQAMDPAGPAAAAVEIPVPAPSPEPPPSPAAAEVPPGVAATLTVPPLEGGETSGEGGEFALLLGRLGQWLAELDLAGKWQQLRGPLRGLAFLVVALVVLRLYGALLGTLAGLPLVPRLLQLVGLGALVQFSVANLLRSRDRQALLSSWSQRWTAFRGQG